MCGPIRRRGRRKENKKTQKDREGKRPASRDIGNF
jgi:hypothetical protein